MKDSSIQKVEGKEALVCRAENMIIYGKMRSVYTEFIFLCESEIAHVTQNDGWRWIIL